MKPPKFVKPICIGGLALLAAGSLIAAALPADAMADAAQIDANRADTFISAINTRPLPIEVRADRFSIPA